MYRRKIAGTDQVSFGPVPVLMVVKLLGALCNRWRLGIVKKYIHNFTCMTLAYLSFCYISGLLDTCVPSKSQLLNNRLYIYNPDHVHRSIFHPSCKGRCSVYLFLHVSYNCVTLCILGNFSCFCCFLLTFFKINFFKNIFRNTFRVSNDLGPNCLQRQKKVVNILYQHLIFSQSSC